MLGGVALVTGAEAFLASRAVDELVARARREEPEISVNRVEAADVSDPGRFAEITGAPIGATYKKYVEGIALGRAQTPEDVAALAR